MCKCWYARVESKNANTQTEEKKIEKKIVRLKIKSGDDGDKSTEIDGTK